MVGAGLIIILSDVDGFYSADPKKSPDAQLIPRIDGLPDEIVRAADKSANPLAHGGMVTKLKAVRVLNTVGIAALVVRGRAPQSIERTIAGEALGTLFVPNSEPLTGRKGWIGTTVTPKGWIRMDEGAVIALAKKGKSLLPRGVLDVNGKFQFGDLVELRGPRGAVLGRGLVNYSAKEIQGIAGKHTREIVSILGHKDYDEIVHRNNMVLIV
jgi:glutamate 5-kinase